MKYKKQFYSIFCSKRTYIIWLCLTIGVILWLYRISLWYAIIDDIISSWSWTRSLLLPEDSPTNQIIKQYIPYQSNIKELLGKNAPKTYLILLMNSAEKKPNGGFFGSYATLTVGLQTIQSNFYDLFGFAESVKYQTPIIHPQIQDTYYPLTKRKATLSFPLRMSGLVELPHITFLWANRLWFTDLDWAYIQELYQKTFDTHIDGVIFVNDRLFSLLLPEYESLKTKRQFQNTYADQIAQTWLIVKKQQTLTEMNNLIRWYRIPMILWQLSTHLQTIQQQKLVQFYLPSASPELTKQLSTDGWITSYSPDTIYLRDLSFGMNKIDRFVTKKTSLRSWQILLWQTYEDILKLPSSWFDSWQQLTMIIEYKLSVPTSYLQELTYRETYFNIKPYPIQQNVLWQNPQRFTQWIVHLPPTRTLVNTTGSAYRYYATKTPFSQISAYRIASRWLFEDQKTITITVRTPE